MTESDYQTDEFGRPNDRNYTYRIPRNSDVATLIANRHLRGRTGRFVIELSDHDGHTLTHRVIQTRDNKGTLDGLGEYRYSEQWERPFRHTRSNWEVRHANNGGTKIHGTFTTCDEYGFERSIHFDGTVSQTLSEVKEIANYEATEELRESFESEIHWLHEDGLDNHRQSVFEAQDNCSHDHFVKDDSALYDSREAIGYCEDCGAELSEDMEIVGGRTI